MARLTVGGSVYRRASGKFQALGPEVYDPSLGRRRRPSLGTFSSRAQATAALITFSEASWSSNSPLTAVDVRGRKLGKYLEWWLELLEGQQRTGKLAVRTVSGYRSAVELHIRPALGHVRIGDLNHLIVHGWLVDLKEKKGLSDRTVVRLYRSLHRALADAPLNANPVALPKHLRPVVRDAKAVYRPRSDEILVFLEHARDCDLSRYSYPLWRVAAVTGARRGELVAIEWTDVDLDAGILRISKSIGYEGADLFVKSTKNEGTRVVGLDDVTVAILRDHRLRTSADALTMGAEYERRPLGLDLVMRRDDTGALYHPNRVSAAFSREWKHAGHETPATLHGLRHSLGSVLLDKGLSVTAVAAQLGHSPQVLLRVYARDLDADVRATRVAAAVSELFG